MIVAMAINALLPLSIPPAWLADHRALDGDVGFDGEAPRRVGAMLLLLDVSGVADVSALGAAGRTTTRAAAAQGARA